MYLLALKSSMSETEIGISYSSVQCTGYSRLRGSASQIATNTIAFVRVSDQAENLIDYCGLHELKVGFHLGPKPMTGHHRVI